MNHGLAFSYFARSANGVSNVLLTTVCILIPAIGPIVLWGYSAEVVDALDRDPERRDHPDFKFDRFSEYLSRGIWPFLVQLVVGMVVALPMIFVLVAGGIASAAANSPIPYLLAWVVALPLMMVAGIVLVLPWSFHAEVTRGFDLAGGWRFVRQFWGLLGGTAFGALLMFAVIAFGVNLLGLLACCVGIYPAAAIVHMASQHVMVQLYQIYLDRGGEQLVPRLPPTDPGYYPQQGYYPPQQGYNPPPQQGRTPPRGGRPPQQPPQEW